VHQSLDSFVHGVRFMATPATCAQFLPGSADFAIDNRPPGYRMLELMPDGAIQTEVCWLKATHRASSRSSRPSRDPMKHPFARWSSVCCSAAVVVGRRPRADEQHHILWSLQGKTNKVYLLGSVHC
jgi:hypothetical protein